MLYQTLSGPITCQVEVDDRCNNNCIHCYNHWRHEDSHRGIKMNKKVLRKVIDDLIRLKIFQVTITGGEPFLNREILFESISELISNNIACALNSNLTLIKKGDAKKLYDIGLRGVMTSFFSFEEEKHDQIAGRKGAYRDTLKGISIVRDCGLKVAVSMVITKMNEMDIVETANFLENYGVSQFFATKASPPVNSVDFQKYMISGDSLIRTLDDLLYLEKEKKMEVGILECYPLCAYKNGRYHFATRRSCSAGITTCTIGADGGVRACSHSDIIFGNIVKESLVDIWKKMRPLRKKTILPSICKKCEYVQDCTGGCRIDAKYCFGRKDALDPYAIPSNVNDISLNKDQEIIMESNDLVALNKKVVLREEEDGILIGRINNPGEPALITYDTYELLSSFPGAFSIADFAKKAELVYADAIELCSMFVKDGILNVSKEK
ncbi:MAG: radical SAM protein [uncultured bacterium]|nr:MAG: radical SAM protein [uncultured bacterium]HBR79629.1 hypothetical protein [Candidatus Moranbacteria bacterium]